MSATLDTGGTAAPHRAAEEWAWRLAPVLTALGALLLDVLLLGRQSLRADEAQAVEAATGSWSGLWDQLRAEQSPAAAFDALLHAWVGLVGSGTWAVRLPSALLAAVAVGLTCALGTRLYGRPAGVVAAGVLGTSVVVVEWSQRAQPATLALAASVAATLALVAALERPTAWRWALWGAAAALTAAASLVAVTVLLAHAVAFAVHRPRPSWRAPAVAAACVAAVALASLALILASDARYVDGIGFPDGRETVDGLWRLSGATAVPLAVAVLGIVMLVTGRVAGARPWSTVLVAAWLVLPVLGALAVSLGRPALDPGLALVAAPALALLVAVGLVTQRDWIALALAALLVATAAYRLAEWYTGPSTEDWRAAVAAIREEQAAGEAVLVLPRREAAAAAYYAGDGFAVDRPRGHRVWLLLAVDDAERRLELARRLVRAPRYALLDERRYGDGVWLQVWAEP